MAMKLSYETLQSRQDVPAAFYERHRHYASPLNILLVEDNPSDELLTRKAIQDVKIPHYLHALHDGSGVVSHLLSAAQDAEHPLPDVILLDLGLPGIDGFDVLGQLSRAPPFVRKVPIIILTAYQDFKNACGIYDLSFLAFLAKPCRSDVMSEMLTQMRYNASFL